MRYLAPAPSRTYAHNEIRTAGPSCSVALHAKKHIILSWVIDSSKIIPHIVVPHILLASHLPVIRKGIVEMIIQGLVGGTMPHVSLAARRIVINGIAATIGVCVMG